MDNTKKLREIEKELELARDAISEKEKSDPPYDTENPAESWNNHCKHLQPEWDALNKLNREKRMLMTPEFQDLPHHGDVMSLKDFIENVNAGGFIDYDGSGNYVSDNMMSNITIYPSDVRYDSIRDDFDKIIWFNR